MKSVPDLEIVEYSFVVVLRRQAGVRQILPNLRPALQTAIVEHLQIVGDDERHDAVCQTLLEHHEPPDTSVAVLKRVDSLEALVQIEDIRQ